MLVNAFKYRLACYFRSVSLITACLGHECIYACSFDALQSGCVDSCCQFVNKSCILCSLVLTTTCKIHQSICKLHFINAGAVRAKETCFQQFYAT
jgi:hypothetical protein